MEKVYVIWFNNCEPYEDNFQDIEAIFKTEEEAVAYLDDMIQMGVQKGFDVKTETTFHGDLEYVFSFLDDLGLDSTARFTIKPFSLGKGTHSFMAFDEEDPYVYGGMHDDSQRF